jgi:excisionase family DNA binding protein
MRRYSTGEAAELLGVSDTTVRKYIDSGELDALDARMPGTTKPAWRISKRSLDAFAERRRNSAAGGKREKDPNAANAANRAGT